jgi:hypothetical protein
VSSVLLRYTGVQATTFMDAGHVEPGGKFEVPDEAAERYLRRPDVESVSEDASRSQDGETSGGTRSGKRARSGSPSGMNDVGETAVP